MPRGEGVAKKLLRGEKNSSVSASEDILLRGKNRSNYVATPKLRQKGVPICAMHSCTLNSAQTPPKRHVRNLLFVDFHDSSILLFSSSCLF